MINYENNKKESIHLFLGKVFRKFHLFLAEENDQGLIHYATH